MNLREVDVSSLREPGYLNRQHSEEQLDRFIRHFREHGQYQPIVVAGDEILCGVLIYRALKALNIEKCYVNDLGASFPLEKRKELRYLDNQIFDIETWNERAISEFLMSLDTSELDQFGFTKEETEMYVDGGDPSDLDDIVPSKSRRLPDRWKCDSCGWEGELPDNQK